MEEKESYTLAEVAMIAEAWRKVGEDEARTMDNLRRYEILAPQSVQDAIIRLRNIEYGYYSCDLSVRESTKKQSDFDRFEEFFKVFG